MLETWGLRNWKRNVNGRIQESSKKFNYNPGNHSHLRKVLSEKIIFKSLRNGKGRLKTKKLNVENKNETNVLQINGNLCSLFCFNLHETCRNFKLFECCFLFLPCLFNEVLNCCILIFFTCFLFLYMK